MSSKESQVTTLDDEDTPVPVVAKPVKVRATPAASAKADTAEADAPEAMYMVTVHATDGDAGSTAVDMCVNGYLYQLPRGVPCKVPESVLEGLRNAVVTKHKVVGNDVIESHIPRFPYSAVPA